MDMEGDNVRHNHEVFADQGGQPGTTRKKKRLSKKFDKLKTQLSSMSDHEIRTLVVARGTSEAAVRCSAAAPSRLAAPSRPLPRPRHQSE